MATAPTPPNPPSAGGAPSAPAPAKAAAGFMRARTFGMPRWAFIGLLMGGVALGLYLRRRRAEAAQEETGMDEDSAFYSSSDETLDAYYEEDAGLAGSGVVAGPAAGSVVPVTAPVIPEGFGDVVGSLSGLGETLGGALADVAIDRPPDRENGSGTAARPGNQPTGGGPPQRPGAQRLVYTPAEYRRIMGRLGPKARERFREAVERDGQRRVISGAEAATILPTLAPGKARAARELGRPGNQMRGKSGKR